MKYKDLLSEAQKEYERRKKEQAINKIVEMLIIKENGNKKAKAVKGEFELFLEEEIDEIMPNHQHRVEL